MFKKKKHKIICFTNPLTWCFKVEVNLFKNQLGLLIPPYNTMLRFLVIFRDETVCSNQHF